MEISCTIATILVEVLVERIDFAFDINSISTLDRAWAEKGFDRSAIGVAVLEALVAPEMSLSSMQRDRVSCC